ncbi:MAG: ribonuclease H-like domain-containing protein [Eubacteriales bacterium]|nr:ribonuclease H-like domain-containing protein [Eubacteriales bacterium]MDD3199600.1 ribonuclease H-like domain-containing protein [Eubacteriales bacterium]MDD4629312.1 ribonuclease H-like domain-containing protein [Eubacteriales bacterium]
MYCTSERCREGFYHSKSLDYYFENLNMGVIDIETTGLNPANSRFMVGGLVVPDSSEKRSIQFLSESPDEEQALLHTYMTALKDIDVLISYNGDNFDLPFLMRRLHRYHISGEDLSLRYSFDLYKILNRFSQLRKLLPNLKQKTVENFLGLWSERTDEISGAESVELYQRFLKTGDQSIRDIILLHNRDDIIQLSRLMKVLEKLDLHEVMFHIGFPTVYKGMKVFIKEIRFQKDSLLVSGVHKNIPIDYRCYHSTHEAVFLVKTGRFSLKIPWMSAKGFRYLDLEDFLIDCSELVKFPGYNSGYLLLTDNRINYAEINHVIKIIVKDILKEL